MNETDNRQPAMIRQDAYSDLTKLAEMMTQDKGVKVNFIDAASIAIRNETRRMERKIARRQAERTTA